MVHRLATHRLTTGLVGLVAVAAFGVALLVPGTAGAADGRTSDYVSRINGLRSSVGVSTLQIDGELTAIAQTCAQRMASTNTLSHSPDITSGITEPWLKLGENVGVGPDDPTIFAAFVASPHHYENMVDPDFDRVGVGVADGGGRQWTCQRFMQVGGSAPTPAASAPTPASRHAASGGSVPSSPPVTPAEPAASDPAVPAGPPSPRPGPPPPANPARVVTLLTALRHLTA
jgi:uncharacterized protein YkwD